MPNRGLLLSFAFLAAGCAAIGLYTLAHDAIGIPSHSIVMDSFGSAAFLATVCAIATVTRRNRK